MGFYYNSGQPPDDEEQSGTLKEAMLITWAVFRALAMPLGILFGGLLGLILLFWLFTLHPLLGVGAIGLVVAAVAGYGVWEAKHPPDLTDERFRPRH